MSYTDTPPPFYSSSFRVDKIVTHRAKTLDELDEDVKRTESDAWAEIGRSLGTQLAVQPVDSMLVIKRYVGPASSVSGTAVEIQVDIVPPKERVRTMPAPITPDHYSEKSAAVVRSILENA
jgi:hypothetical protein